MSEIALPETFAVSTMENLDELTSQLGVSRDALPSRESIQSAWAQLPRVLGKIPAQYRTEQHLRMCVAVANGLYDAAINYIWNAAILRIRDRVRAFGLSVVGQILQKSFDENGLKSLRDSELLDHCRRLNLLSEDAFFFLEQCRGVRNNFSTAHPTLGYLDDVEVISFLNRCARYAMSDTSDPKGVDIPALMSSLKSGRFTDEQRTEWARRLSDSHDVQRETAVGMLHGVYCDADAGEESRVNSLALCKALIAELTSASKSMLLNRHSDYVARGLEAKQQASRTFFQEMGLFSLLGDREQHYIFSRAASLLDSAHEGYDNFYNEPPFARRLLELSSQAGVPATAQGEFVEVVIKCAIGNVYGVSARAEPVYHQLVRGFSPQEVAYMLALPESKSIVKSRIHRSRDCKTRFKALVAMLDRSTVPAKVMTEYERWLSA